MKRYGLLLAFAIVFGILEYFLLEVWSPGGSWYQFALAPLVVGFIYYFVARGKYRLWWVTILFTLFLIPLWGAVEDIAYYLTCNVVGNCTLPDAFFKQWRESVYGNFGKFLEINVNMPMHYFIGIIIPFAWILLTSDFIQKCEREKAISCKAGENTNPDKD